MRGGPQRTGVPEDPAKKIIPRAKAAPLFSRLRRQGKRIVLTNGCFDILHAGHARYLRQAAGLGDVLVVGLNSDDSVRRLKGPGRPVVAAVQRAEVLAGLEAVDAVLVFDELDPERVIRALRPDVLVKGGDWTVDRIVGAEFVQSRGGVVRSLPYVAGTSTTELIRRIAAAQRD